MITAESRLKSRKGFTLLELVVVILIIGILAAFAVPQYMNSLETNKAEDAAALVNMVATTNRMFALDHGNTYTSGTLTNACNGGGACLSGGNTDPCNLVYCKYLAATDWDSKPYIMAAGTGAACSAGGVSGAAVACAGRRTSGTGSTTRAPYTGWGFTVSNTGVISAIGGAPTPAQ